MANPEHLEILKSGVKEWNGWREANQAIAPDLSEHRLESEGPRDSLPYLFLWSFLQTLGTADEIKNEALCNSRIGLWRGQLIMSSIVEQT